MLSCRHVTRLISQSMDAQLGWPQRWAMRVHLLYCVWCRRYAAQLQFLRQAARQINSPPLQTPPPTLSPTAKEQIRARLQQALKNPPGSPQ
jgi:hypothetical protein